MGSLTSSGSNYILNYKRYLTGKEALLFQGFPKSFKQVVSNHQLHK
jgi:hypothetical protein